MRMALEPLIPSESTSNANWRILQRGVKVPITAKSRATSGKPRLGREGEAPGAVHQSLAAWIGLGQW